jgi:hypothetical protein
MRRTSLWILALSLVVGACSSDSDPIIADIDQMRVVKVSGDQTSQVPAAASHTIYATAGASLAVLDGLGYTPEPLVARVEAVGMQSRGTGPSSVIPPGTLVHWQIPEVAGRLFGGTTATDDSAHVINRYAPGTRAGTYIAYAGRMVGSEIEIDAEWELVVEPGAAVRIATAKPTDAPYRYEIGDTIDARTMIAYGEDGHFNRIAADVIRATPDSLVSWEWTDASAANAQPIHGEGWTVPVSDFAARGYPTFNYGDGLGYPVFLRLYIDAAAADRVRLDVNVP